MHRGSRTDTAARSPESPRDPAGNRQALAGTPGACRTDSKGRTHLDCGEVECVRVVNARSPRGRGRNVPGSADGKSPMGSRRGKSPSSCG